MGVFCEGHDRVGWGSRAQGPPRLERVAVPTVKAESFAYHPRSQTGRNPGSNNDRCRREHTEGKRSGKKEREEEKMKEEETGKGK